jgi:hypothetical protein
MKLTMDKQKRLPKTAVGLTAALVKAASVFYIFTLNRVYVFAGGAAPPAADADALERWNAVLGLLTPWIGRLGGVVMLIGGIMFGLGFKNDDADSKTRGLQTLVAGAIVIAVGASYQTFVGA